MDANYEPFVERMIGMYEGGYGWHPADPGGPTKYGITCYDLAQYYGEQMNSMSAWAPRVKAMTLKVADEIYKNKYASQCAFSALNSGPDCVVFDFGVNSGPSRAIMYSQAVVGTTRDGVLGPVTLAAINAHDPTAFVNELCDARLRFLRALGTWGTFGVGWRRRVSDLRAYSLALVHPVQERVDEAVTAEEHQDKERRITKAFAKAGDDETAAVA